MWAACPHAAYRGTGTCRLHCRPTAIHRQGSAGDHARVGAGEVDGRSGHVLGRRQLASGDAVYGGLAECVVRQPRPREASLDEGRGDGVDGDAVLRPLDGEGLGQEDDRGLAGAVDGLSRNGISGEALRVSGLKLLAAGARPSPSEAEQVPQLLSDDCECGRGQRAQPALDERCACSHQAMQPEHGGYA